MDIHTSIGVITADQQAIALQWAITLEHGTYKQGKFLLRQANNKCCCWGVLCDIVDPKGWSKTPAVFNESRTKTYRHGEHQVGAGRGVWAMPSHHVTNSIGLADGSCLRYASMNDTGASFMEIAAQIRHDFGLPPQPTALPDAPQ